MAQGTRRLRVGAELHRLLNELLRTEVKDPRLDGVTVNEVEMSGDLSVAKVYYATLDPEQDTSEVEAAFLKANGFLRGRVGQALRVRRTPELHFIRDESARRGAELTRLIDSLAAQAPPDESGSAYDDADDDPSDSAGDTAGDDSER